MSHSIRTCLWFRDGRGKEAAEFYCSRCRTAKLKIFVGDNGYGTFTVADFKQVAPYQILDAGAHVYFWQQQCRSLSPPMTAETDRLWYALTSNGGEESVWVGI